MAETLSAFDYKTLEEVYSVIHFLTSALSASVAHLLELLDDGTLDGQGASGNTIDSYRFIGDSVRRYRHITMLLTRSSGFRAGCHAFHQCVNRCRYRPVVERPLEATVWSIRRVSGASQPVLARMLMSYSKCNKFVVGKKTASGDKLATKRSDKAAVVSWDKMPAAIQGVTTVGQFEAQRATVSYFPVAAAPDRADGTQQ